MSASILIVPGYRGSDTQHWQSWLEHQSQETRRVEGINWDAPVLSDWASQIRKALQKASQPMWIVAHSFGCLASAVAVADLPEQTAGVIFVAPADAERFTALGCCEEDEQKPALSSDTISDVVPSSALLVPGLLIASRNDPWLHFDKARTYEKNWSLRLLDLGEAGHINSASGFGDWPMILDLLNEMRLQFPAPLPLSPEQRAGMRRMKAGRGSALAKVRQKTRYQLDRLPLIRP